MYVMDAHVSSVSVGVGVDRANRAARILRTCSTLGFLASIMRQYIHNQQHIEDY
jgi:hypothetical protein